jgi:hypothetical protein
MAAAHESRNARIVAVYQLRRDLWQELYDQLSEDDVAEFNQAHGFAYTRAEYAYVAPTITLLDQVLSGYYGQEIAFRTYFRRIVWGGEYIHIEVEVTYKPLLVWN